MRLVRWACTALGTATLGCMAAGGPPVPAGTEGPGVASPPPLASPSPHVLPSVPPNRGVVSTLAWKNESLEDLAVAADGTVYVAALDGIFALSPDGTSATKVADVRNEVAFPDVDPSVVISNPSGVDVAPDGTLMVGALGGLMHELRPDRSRTSSTLPDREAYEGLVADRAGHVYTVSRYDGVVYRRDPGGRWSPFAGRRYQELEADGSRGVGFADGSGAAARFSYPTDLAIDSRGRVLVADNGNGAIRRITPEGDVTTLWGPRPGAGAVPPPSPPPEARPDPTPTPQVVPGPGLPTAIAVGPDDTIYFASTDNRLRRLAPDGTATVVAGDGTYCRHLACQDTCPEPEPWTCFLDGIGTAARFDQVEAMGVSPSGAIYLLDGGSAYPARKLRVVR